MLALRGSLLLPARHIACRCAATRAHKARRLHSSSTVVRSCAAEAVVEDQQTQPQVVVTPVQPGEQLLEFRCSFKEVLEKNQKKLRLDHFLTSRLPELSRSQLQYGIKRGLVSLNGNPQLQKHTNVRPGDMVRCMLPSPPATSAIPEDIPIDIVYEDEYLMVINKAAGMVVHPAPGNATGTLVNAVLYHCRLPALRLLPGQEMPSALDAWPDPDAPSPDEISDEDEVETVSEPSAATTAAPREAPLVRPGIVHRLDKGTTGLMVVAKDAKTQWHLSDQFREHTVERTYNSIMLRVPIGPKGIVETKIARSSKDRKKMAPLPLHSNKGRYAKSTFQLLEAMPGNAASLVQWNLSTGRTHQIRVHAQHINHPLLGDATYGSNAAALHVLARNNNARRVTARKLLEELGRPALHAKSLGFDHPASGERLRFDSELPPDFSAALAVLRQLC